METVHVFTRHGTTYTPLRASTEAYGLEVGYDAKSNAATVTNPAKVSGFPAVADYGSEKIHTAVIKHERVQDMVEVSQR